MSETEMKPRRSGVLIVPPTATIGTCLDVMVKANVGSILVADDFGLHGIVTERDVLRRWQEFSDGTFRHLAVTALATKPVFALTVTQIADAPKEMIERKIRHIPLVDAQGRVIGIMSMRDILAAQLRARTLPTLAPVPTPLPAAKPAPAPPSPPLSKTLHIVKPTAGLQEVTLGFLPKSWRAKTWPSFKALLDAPELAPDQKLGRQAVLLDIDGIGDEDWRPLIRKLIKFLASADRPQVFIVSSQDLAGSKDLEPLKAVADKAQWRLYLRPIPISTFEQDLSSLVIVNDDGEEE